MKAFAATLCLLTGVFGFSQNVVTTDIDNFWIAYDKIRATNDSIAQYAYIDTFIKNGTPGLHGIMQARRYTPASYVLAIGQYPEFWESVRPNTLLAGEFATAIDKHIANFRKLYPALKPANIYFTVGAFRTNGTTLNGNVLIGSELALADETAVTTEFPDQYSHLRPFFDTNPINDVVFLNVHEYVHTQQPTTIGNSLLAQCVIEGVAEFLATRIMAIPSPTEAVKFGPKHDKRIKDRFMADMFNPLAFYDWLWNDISNEFQMRDLGYYTGYAIAEGYYNKAADKSVAIKQMIELDYNNPQVLAAFVDQSGYLPKPALEYLAAFESTRPTVIAMGPFENGSSNVKPGKATITLTFSEPMDRQFRNFELGPLGEEHILRISRAEFAPDGKSITLETDLEPNKHYQLEIGYQFRTRGNIPLRPYLIDFKTSE